MNIMERQETHDERCCSEIRIKFTGYIGSVCLLGTKAVKYSTCSDIALALKSEKAHKVFS